MVEVDLILWAVRADRPERAPEAAPHVVFEARPTATPVRRFAPVVTVMTFADRIVRNRFTMLSNETPQFRDTSGAIVSRIVLLRTTESFLGR